MDMCGNASAYTASSLVKQFHDFPHKSRDFKTVSSDFDPLDVTYLEGAAFTGAVCILAGSVLFFMILLYLCCCACRKHRVDYMNYKSEPGCHWGWAILFVAVCTCGLGLAYFGNEYVKQGVEAAAKAINDGNQTVAAGQVQVSSIIIDLDSSEQTLLNLEGAWIGKGLPTEVQQSLVDQTIEARRQVGNAEYEAINIRTTINNVFDAGKYAEDLKKYDKWRWEGTLGALCAIVALLCLIVLGVCLGSSCTLKLTAFLMLFGLLVAWAAAGGFLFVAVAGSDFCISPNSFVDRELEDMSQTYSETVKYFIYCQDCPNPFESDYRTTMESLNTVSNQLFELKTVAERYPNLDLSDVLADIAQLKGSLTDVQTRLQSLWHNQINCTSLNAAYKDLIASACGKTIDGAVYTFGAGCVIGFGAFFLIMAVQQHWTRILTDDAWFEGEGTTLLDSRNGSGNRRRRRGGSARTPPSHVQQDPPRYTQPAAGYRRQEDVAMHMAEHNPYQDTYRDSKPREAWGKSDQV